MSREEILNKIQNIAFENSYLHYDTEQDIKEEYTLKDHLGFDSIDNVVFILEIEKQFNIAISDNVADSLLTIKQFVDIVEKQIR